MFSNTAQDIQRAATVSQRHPKEPRESRMDLSFLELFIGHVWDMAIGKSSVSAAPASQFEAQLTTIPSTVTSKIKASLDPRSFDPKKRDDNYPECVAFATAHLASELPCPHSIGCPAGCDGQSNCYGDLSNAKQLRCIRA
jgi:hypothetical protein